MISHGEDRDLGFGLSTIQPSQSILGEYPMWADRRGGVSLSQYQHNRVEYHQVEESQSGVESSGEESLEEERIADSLLWAVPFRHSLQSLTV